MAFSAAFHTCSRPSLILSCRTHKPNLSQTAFFQRTLTVRASTTLDYSKLSVQDKALAPSKTNSWQWKFKDNSVNIYYEEYEKEREGPCKNILMIPTISDVSTVEEWRSVASNIVQQAGNVNWQATIVDWPGLGYSDRLKMDYTADVMEKFLVDFINSADGSLSGSENDFVVFGGGHAATLTIRAAKRVQ